MERRPGKIQARHWQVNDLYDVALRETADGVRLFWQMREERRNWRESREGAYVLGTTFGGANGRRVRDQTDAVDRGRSLLPRAEERAFDPASLPHEKAVRQGSRNYGWVTRCGLR
jgi:hypothetical protein